MIIKVDQEKIRLDKYLFDKLDYSRTMITNMINDSFILVNNIKVKPSYKIKLNDLISIKDGYQKEMDILPEDIPLNIVYEDEDIMVINKSSGMVVHPGSGNYSHTLVNALMFYSKNLSDINGKVRPGIVHRLDAYTSGLMLVAKTNKAHVILSDDFKHKRVKREYIALLDGVLPHNSATIDAPIGRDELERKRMTVTSNNSKNAITHLKVIKRFTNNTLVSLLLDTGRTHQIRVHMKYIGYPVTNDPVYGKCFNKDFNQMLHSKTISFVHPITKKEMFFTSELPEHFESYINNLK